MIRIDTSLLMFARAIIILTLIIPSLSLALESPLSILIPTLNKASIAVIDDKGKKDNALKTLLEKELIFQRRYNKQLEQFSVIQKIARYESRLLTERMHAQAYYDSVIRFTIDDDSIFYNVSAGKQYSLSEISLILPDGLTIPKKILELDLGMPINAEKVLKAKNLLDNYIEQNLCLFTIDTDYQVYLDKKQHTGKLQLTLSPSPAAQYGNISFEGLETIDESYLSKLVAIEAGECFKRETIETAKLKLVQSSLLASASTKLIGPDSLGKVDIHFTVLERKHRTLSAGGGYQSDEGLGLFLGWEHRNLFSKAQKLDIEAKLAEKKQGLSAEFTIPYFLMPKQSLIIYNEYDHSETDAFTSKTLDIGAQVSRNFKRRFNATLGSEFIFSSVIEDEVEEDYTLFSIPLGLSYDRRNKILDPRKGWIVSGQLNGYWEIDNTDRQFNKITFSASHYLSFDKLFLRPTLASRFATGAIAKITREEIPTDLRYYVGGGGSVRGYAYQSLSSYTDDEPDGGLSFTEISNEIRVQFNTTWGGVIFVDGGYAYEQRNPQVGEDLHWGAGIGVRYYTSFAPIRFDIATPLDKREDIDDDLQVYISIGQAF